MYTYTKVVLCGNYLICLHCLHSGSFFVVIVLQKAFVYLTGRRQAPYPTPFIGFCFKNYDNNVCELVGVCPVNGTSSTVNRDF